MADNMADGLPSTWPIILNKSLEQSEVHRLLGQSHKVRVTDTTGQGVVIFPLSSVAFMIVPLDQVFKENDGQYSMNQDIIDRIQRLNQLHRRAFVILVAARMGPEEMQALVALQNRFLGANARFIPSHSAKECVDCMLTIAKVTCKPMAGVIQERMKKLQESTVSDNVVLRVLANIGLSNHECLVLQDGCKTVARVSQATEEDLMDCSLDHHTAQKIINFFEKDSILI
ncbi:protein SPO16 homolog [Oculina patagonica]